MDNADIIKRYRKAQKRLEPPVETTGKVVAIRKSLACFRFGVASLIPLLGYVFTHMAFVRWEAAMLATEGKWNPARAYLRWGLALAIFGAVVSTIIVGLILSVILKYVK